MRKQSWKNIETTLTLEIGQDVFEIVAIHSGSITPERFGLYPEDSSPEECDVEIHQLSSGYKNNAEMSESELEEFAEKYDGLIGDEILNKQT